MAGGEEFEFVCPECGESIAMNAAMREAMIANGCVLCGADVGPDAFVPASDHASD